MSEWADGGESSSLAPRVVLFALGLPLLCPHIKPPPFLGPLQPVPASRLTNGLSRPVLESPALLPDTFRSADGVDLDRQAPLESGRLSIGLESADGPKGQVASHGYIETARVTVGARRAINLGRDPALQLAVVLVRDAGRREARRSCSEVWQGLAVHGQDQVSPLGESPTDGLEAVIDHRRRLRGTAPAAASPGGATGTSPLRYNPPGGKAGTL
ncbi:hypothetical protein CDD83_7161 [Cordyceps sp. RAO-2017]|nr:hypothetical protein CDD83_7161 [Cordyceps sp. RAO-2017]